MVLSWKQTRYTGQQREILQQGQAEFFFLFDSPPPSSARILSRDTSDTLSSSNLYHSVWSGSTSAASDPEGEAAHQPT